MPTREYGRPNPDDLLASVNLEQAKARRGRLKIFFGASAGVGKTYAMLETARLTRLNGVDIVAGYIEPHGRAATEKLVEGLEVIPYLMVSYRNITKREFDLDATLKRHPSIVLVDELAHSNLTEGKPEPRHAKRWQDVEELLESGISVWTTLNVQHLESLSDVIAAITGIHQHERIPDRIFDNADEVELIDLPPEDLIARLKAGHIYNKDQAATAVENFFKIPNLLAMRELALRKTADRVDAAARAISKSDLKSKPWLSRDRFLIAVAPDDYAEGIIRIGKRFADALDAEWIVVTVETPSLLNLSDSARNKRVGILRFAESLGAETVTLDGPNSADALIEYAKVRNVSRIVVGEPSHRGYLRLILPSTATRLVRKAKDIDISVLARRDPQKIAHDKDIPLTTPIPWRQYWLAIGISFLCTVLAETLYGHVELTNIVMVYLLGASITGLRVGRGPSILTAFINVLLFDFCFVPPRFSLAVTDFEYIITFAVMLAVALIISGLASNVRAQTKVAGARERRTALLYAMSRELAAVTTIRDIFEVATRHLNETFKCSAQILTPSASTNTISEKNLRVSQGETDGNLIDYSIAQWVFDHNKPAGLGTDTLPAADSQYLPLNGSNTNLGVVVVTPAQKRTVLLPEQQHLLETFVSQIGIALERSLLVKTAEGAKIQAETESIRSALLGSISHDIRTPLSIIIGASSALTDPKLDIDTETRVKLATSIDVTARNMSDLITNVLDLTKLETGSVNLRRDWISIQDLIFATLTEIRPAIKNYSVNLNLNKEAPLVYLDASLIKQLFSNILINVSKHTPPQTKIWIEDIYTDAMMTIRIEDNGPGLSSDEFESIFAKFQRGHDKSNVGGAGLGLAICRAIANAHQGTIIAEKSLQGGACFVISLPYKK